MRTTLDIADDVLFAAKEVARREKKPLGTSSANWRGAHSPNQRLACRTPSGLKMRRRTCLSESPVTAFTRYPRAVGWSATK